MTKIEEVYTVPKTVEECDLLNVDRHCVGDAVLWIPSAEQIEVWPIEEVGTETSEIPVPKFLDLLHDRIVPWRLEEVGFAYNAIGVLCLFLRAEWPEFELRKDHVFVFTGGVMRLNGYPVNITTFTDLLTQIRFLTPPTK